MPIFFVTIIAVMGRDYARATPSSTLPARQMSASNYLCAHPEPRADELLRHRSHRVADDAKARLQSMQCEAATHSAEADDAELRVLACHDEKVGTCGRLNKLVGTSVAGTFSSLARPTTQRRSSMQHLRAVEVRGDGVLL
jgi:hypothetical protein